MHSYDILFVVVAYVFQLTLIIHFALRRWHFSTAMRFGRVVYGLSVPAAIASLFILTGGKDWFLWIGGFIYLIWAIFGFTVEYIKGIEWRNSLRWPVLGPYLILYLATWMFYWWPLARLYKPFWYISLALFLISTYLNITSHKKPSQPMTAGRKIRYTW